MRTKNEIKALMEFEQPPVEFLKWQENYIKKRNRIIRRFVLWNLLKFKFKPKTK